MRSLISTGRIPILVVALGALSACDRSGLQYVPDSIDGFPGIVHLGELEVVPVDDRDNHIEQYASYDTVGPAPTGTRGGVTATVTATGSDLCIIVDPESVFWNQSVATNGANNAFTWPDNATDDGDLDIQVGLAGYYTGTPGFEIGDFEQIYEDSLGTETAIEYNECTMLDINGRPGAAAGRGAPEYCTIETALHPDRSYMILLNTFSVPLDDFKLDYAINVYDVGEGGACSDIFDELLSSKFGDNKVEHLLPMETDAPGFEVFETVFAMDHHSVWCECTSDLNPDNTGCARLEGNNYGWTIDYEAGTAKNGNFDIADMSFPSQCGEFDPDAFADDDLEEEEG